MVTYCSDVASTFRRIPFPASSMLKMKSFEACFTIPISRYGMKYCMNCFSSYGISHEKSGWFSV